MERHAAVAEALRSRPPLYTTMRTDHSFNERTIYEAALPTVEARMQNTLAAERARANMLVRNKIVMDAYAAQDRLVRNLNAQHIDTGMAGWDRHVDPMTGLPVFRAENDEENCPIIPLPTDAVVAHTPAAQSRTDLVPIQEHVCRQACMVMGVPPFAVGMQGGGQAMGAQAASSAGSLKTTVDRFRHMLTTVLSDVYELLYDDKEQVTVVFPSTQDHTRMSALFQQRVLTYDAYKTYVGQSMALDESLLEQEDPRVADDAQVPEAAPPRKKPKKTNDSRVGRKEDEDV